MGHEHNVRDSDARFIIDPATKTIRKESKNKIVLVQGDHNSEVFSFKCPRFIESHDMSQCNTVEVHFYNYDSQLKQVNSGKYTVEDLKVGEDENTVEFSWLISGNGTQLQGHIEFLIRFKCIEEDVVTYAWNTLFFTDTSIGKGSNVDESFETEYVDIIEQWKASVLQGFEEEFTAWKEKTERQVATDINKWKQEATEEVDDHFNAHSAEWNQKLAVERARIDQFTRLPEGSTAGDAELMDVRVGADGVTYDSAGAAVREQIASVVKRSAVLETDAKLVGAIVDQFASAEELKFAYTSTYPNSKTFEYEEKTAKDGYWVYKQSAIAGGILSVDWDTNELTQFDVILYLFDIDGNPYKYAQSEYDPANKNLSGEKYNVVWCNPGVSGGFCKATAPFTVQIPDGCTVMLCMRSANAIFPEGSSLTGLSGVAPTFFNVTVSKIEDSTATKLDKNQGSENANRRMVTNTAGEIVPGEIDPHSMALRPNWDTVIHRGWISGAIENTVPAFYLAKENGYLCVECDVRMTADGIPVLAHDATVTGINTNGASVTLTVAESTLAELQALVLETHDRFGAIKINTLADLLSMARLLGMKILIDIKVSGESAMKSIAQTVIRYGMMKNVVYMPNGVTNAAYIAKVDKNASFDFVMYGTEPTVNTDLSGYTTLLTGSNYINLDIQANTWAFVETDVDAINAAGLGLSFWNVLQSNIAMCLDAGAVRLTKHNDEDATDLDEIYLNRKTFW